MNRVVPYLRVSTEAQTQNELFFPALGEAIAHRQTECEDYLVLAESTDEGVDDEVQVDNAPPTTLK